MRLKPGMTVLAKANGNLTDRVQNAKVQGMHMEISGHCGTDCSFVGWEVI
jgi:hypothetical protein